MQVTAKVTIKAEELGYYDDWARVQRVDTGDVHGVYDLFVCADSECGCGDSSRNSVPGCLAKKPHVTLRIHDANERTAAGPTQTQPKLLKIKTDDASRGVYWAVGQVSPNTVDFLLGQNTLHWANTSLAVSTITRGILQCCNSVAINRSGHLQHDYHNATRNQLQPAIFAPFRQRNLDVFVDVGAVEGPTGLNCSNVPESGSANSTCVTPAQICQAALSRKDLFAAEVLELTLAYNLSGVSVDWEFQYGNNQTCFAALWKHVAGVLAAHSKEFAPWVNNGGGWQGPSWYVSTEWNYWSYLPFADKLLNMGSYRATTVDKTGSLVPVKCDTIHGWHRFTENATGRWWAWKVPLSTCLPSTPLRSKLYQRCGWTSASTTRTGQLVRRRPRLGGLSAFCSSFWSLPPRRGLCRLLCGRMGR
jgi:hypothetical protein